MEKWGEIDSGGMVLLKNLQLIIDKKWSKTCMDIIFMQVSLYHPA
jgi:hypothetical protein